MENQWQKFQGGMQIARIPKVSGLYAWYYRPLTMDTQAVTKTLSSFLDAPAEVVTEIQMRYGVRLLSKSNLNLVYGQERRAGAEVIAEAVACADAFLENLFKSGLIEFFTRPIYIGIAKNLYQRVYTQHYESLDKLWNDDSAVSKHLNLFPDATVQSTMDKLNIPHSFALEARVRRIAPRDLVVHIYQTDNLPAGIGPDSEYPESDPAPRRALEQLLQLVADPVCGRR